MECCFTRQPGQRLARPPAKLRGDKANAATLEGPGIRAKARIEGQNFRLFVVSAFPAMRPALGETVLVERDSCRVWRSGSGPTKRVVAKANVSAPLPQVLRVLTDYNALPRFVPDLVVSEVLPGAPAGRIRLRQRVRNGGGFWSVEAGGVLEVEESELPTGGREVRFQLVEGDLPEYYGRWVVEPRGNGGHASVLHYDAVVGLEVDLPDVLFDHAVRVWLPANVEALKTRAEDAARQRAQPPQFAADALEAEVQFRSQVEGEASSNCDDGDEAATGAGPSGYCGVEELPWKSEAGKLRVGPPLHEGMPSEYLGTTSVPLPPIKPSISGNRGAGGGGSKGGCSQGGDLAEDSYPAFDFNSRGPGMSEVHLRKLDTLNCVHRRMVAMISVSAPSRDVWGVITDYANLAQILPNLAVSEVLDHPQGAPEGYWRIRQVAVKFHKQEHPDVC